MKKKLLSLVLAGAMVASTSVSAFAATPTTTQGKTTIQEGQEDQDVQVDITGNILDNRGNAVAGTINVSVPTATSFSVNSTTGDLFSADMVITNNSDEKIKVIAKGFKDPSGAQDIELVTKQKFDEAGGKEHIAKGKVWLKLAAGERNIGLVSDEKGKMYDNEYAQEVTENNGEIGKLSANQSLTLRLKGEGGTNGAELNTPIRDEFKLILKIKRDRE